jgi:glycosyltransferase involved in cell wall biosynthesis
VDRGHRVLVQLARRLRLQHRLTFTRRISLADMPAVMRSADVLVSLTTAERFAIVPLEAMACGIPMLASTAVSQRDAVIEGTTGFLVPSAEPALLARRIRKLLESPLRLEGFGFAAATRARDRYS